MHTKLFSTLTVISVTNDIHWTITDTLHAINIVQNSIFFTMHWNDDHIIEWNETVKTIVFLKWPVLIDHVIDDLMVLISCAYVTNNYEWFEFISLILYIWMILKWDERDRKRLFVRFVKRIFVPIRSKISIYSRDIDPKHGSISLVYLWKVNYSQSLESTLIQTSENTIRIITEVINFWCTIQVKETVYKKKPCYYSRMQLPWSLLEHGRWFNCTKF